MPPEPHTRRRRAAWRVTLVAAAAGLLLTAGPALDAQVLPTTSTTAPAEETTTTTTTQAPVLTTTTAPVQTTTTAAVSETTTTAVRSAPTTSAPTTTRELDVEAPAIDDAADDEGEVLETTTTGRNLLVPGDGSEGAQSTTTTSTTVAEIASDGGIDEETQVWLIVAGLVAVAFLIGAWTVRYWIRTKPEPAPEEPDPTTVFSRR